MPIHGICCTLDGSVNSLQSEDSNESTGETEGGHTVEGGWLPTCIDTGKRITKDLEYLKTCLEDLDSK